MRKTTNPINTTAPGGAGLFDRRLTWNLIKRKNVSGAFVIVNV